MILELLNNKNLRQLQGDPCLNAHECFECFSGKVRQSLHIITKLMRIHKKLISCMRLDHVLYSINYGIPKLYCNGNDNVKPKLWLLVLHNVSGNNRVVLARLVHSMKGIYSWLTYTVFVRIIAKATI